MHFKMASMFLFNIIIILFIIPNVMGIGEFTVDIYETKKIVTFTGNETITIIYFEGAVNYTGYNPSGDTIELSSSSDVGESGVSPEEIVFYSTASEEFNVELTISNTHRHGKKGDLDVEGSLETISILLIASDNVEIIIFNNSLSEDDDLNNDNSLNINDEDLVNNMIGPIIISIVIVLIMVFTYVKYKKH